MQSMPGAAGMPMVYRQQHFSRKDTGKNSDSQSPLLTKILCSKVFSPLVKLDELVEHDPGNLQPVSCFWKQHQFGIWDF